MHLFKFTDESLHCENVPVHSIAGEVATPLYVYSKNTILENYDRVDRAFEGLAHQVCYALKANSNETVLSLLSQRGAGADVVSGGELYLALKCGFKPENIVYAGVGKTDDEIRYALRENILAFHVESLAELHVINTIAESMNAVARVALRVNPNIDIHGHPYISTGRAQDKFGIELAEVRDIIHGMDSYANLSLIGLHFHNGSQITESAPYIKTIEIAGDLLGELRQAGIELHYVDIGGGVAVRYEHVFSQGDEGVGITPQSLIEELLPSLKSLGCKILFEPGRSLVAEAGCLITKVLYEKETSGKRFLIVDASMTELIRPSLYQAYHEIVPLRGQQAPEIPYDVVGPVCESGDFLARDRMLPPTRRGDYLAVMTCGAYGFSLSSNYNARVRPAEVLVDGDRYSVIRPRGEWEHLWRP